MRSISLTLLVVLGVGLAACSSPSYKPASTQPATTAGQSSAQPAGTALAPPVSTARAAAPAASGNLQSGWVSSYPYGTAGATSGSTAGSQVVATEAAPAPSLESGWRKPDVSSEQHQADIESCYRYAESQVERDIRIESDVDAARYDQDSGQGNLQLTRRMSAYDHRKRRTSLINSCMQAKGYSQG